MSESVSQQGETAKPLSKPIGGTLELAVFMAHSALVVNAYVAYRKALSSMPDLLALLPKLAKELEQQ